jgi:hypothetical protein
LRYSVAWPNWPIRTLERSSGVFFAALFPLEAQQGFFVLAHDDPGVGAADKVAVVGIRSHPVIGTFL